MINRKSRDIIYFSLSGYWTRRICLPKLYPLPDQSSSENAVSMQNSSTHSTFQTDQFYANSANSRSSGKNPVEIKTKMHQRRRCGSSHASLQTGRRAPRQIGVRAYQCVWKNSQYFVADWHSSGILGGEFLDGEQWLFHLCCCREHPLRESEMWDYSHRWKWSPILELWFGLSRTRFSFTFVRNFQCLPLLYQVTGCYFDVVILIVINVFEKYSIILSGYILCTYIDNEVILFKLKCMSILCLFL